MSRVKQRAAKAVAEATAQSAYVKQQLVELSVANEAKLRDLLQDLNLLQAKQSRSTAAGVLQPTKHLQQHYAALYDQLLEYGFTTEHVQEALAALLPAAAAAGLDECLDWLCVNVPHQQLPRRFTGSSRAAAGSIAVKVVAKADNEFVSTAPSSSNDDSSVISDAGDDQDDQLVAAAAAAPDDKEAAKAWILQQYMVDDSDDGDAGQDRQQQQQQADEEEVIEDWELWGDPREIERRKAERAFSRLPPEQQKAALAAEYAAARQWAAAAKAAGDKQKQKEAGQLIGTLKMELKKVGLAEDDVITGGKTQQQQQQQRGGTPAAAAAAGGDNADQEIDTKQQQQQQQDDEDVAELEAAAKAKKKKKPEKSALAKQRAAAAAAAAEAEAAAAARKAKKARDKAIDKVKEYKEAKLKKKHGDKVPKQGSKKGKADKKSATAAAAEDDHSAATAAAAAAASVDDDEDWAPDVAQENTGTDATATAAAAAAAGSSALAANASEADALQGLSEENAQSSGDVEQQQQQQQQQQLQEDKSTRQAAAQTEQSQLEPQQQQQQQQHASTGSRFSADDDKASKTDTTAEPSTAATAGSNDADDFQLPDIFDEAVAAEYAPDSSSTATAAAAAKPPVAFTPWGAYGVTKSKPKQQQKGVKPQQQQPAVEYKSPKALLQQHCQKHNMQPPRFERITVGPEAAALAATAAAAAGKGQYRYKVTLAPAATAAAGTSKGAKSSSGSSKKSIVGVTASRTYQLFADEDGWHNVQDAQNAAAARALFALHKAALAAAAGANAAAAAVEESMHWVYHQLEPQWAGLWDLWWGAESVGTAAAAVSVEEVLEAEREQQRNDFLQSLLTRNKADKQQQQQQQPVADRAGANATSTAEQGRAAAAYNDDDKNDSTSLEADGVTDVTTESNMSDGELVTHGEEAEEWLLAAGYEQDDQADDLAAAAAAAAAAQEQQQQQQQRREDAAAARKSERLKERLLTWLSSPEGQAMHAQRSKLPMSGLKQQIIASLQTSDALVVSGETGSGKTTQVPQFLLEDAVAAGNGASCHVIVTQPRRIAAISVAERVAAERGEQGPGVPGCAVGYHVRLDAAVNSDTQLLFCTTGILLRRLASDPLLQGVTHVVVDEVHERSLQGDVLMALLQRIAAVRNRAADAAGSQQQQQQQQPQRLKVILMSATLDANIYSSYYWNCPVLSCPGRTFPVAVKYLEDCYEATRYILAPDARAALRAGSAAAAAAAAKRKESARGNAAKSALMAAGWGDEESLQGALNPYYDPDVYYEYPDHVRRNLARLNEDVLDLDFLEEMISWADHETPLPGAILVFLPGKREWHWVFSWVMGI